MAAQNDSSAALSADDIAYIFKELDVELNSTIFQCQLHGIYTGIVAFTLWNIYTKKFQPIRRVMIMVVVVLHVMATIDLALCWSYTRFIHVKHGQTVADKYLACGNLGVLQILMTATGIISTICTDSAMIWRCWMVWGKRRPVVVLPILFLISGTVFKTVMAYEQSVDQAVADALYSLLLVLYLAFILATTLWCTLMIIFRIFSVGRASTGSGRPFKVYRPVIENLVGSSAFYAIFLLLDMVFVACQSTAYRYMDTTGAFARGVAPTLLIGRVAAGHARPDDSWEGSVTSSLRFGRDSEQIGSQDDATQSVTVDNDLEIPPEGEDNLEDVSEQPRLNDGDF
ncbi:hypothetical protein F5146DRAFT_1036156 [Armillaria mellea]|nr:hypothetical protein F5146DRAFT_1036156 [Armillaria mellea]